jgi:VWFA-related protein
MIIRAGFLIAVVATLAAAQDPAQPADQQRPPTFRTGTNVVRVDVTVTDSRGEPVRALTADDFEVFENGARQPITSFKFLEATGQPTDDLSLPIRSREHAAAEAARDDVRVFLIFWDEYHINRLAGAQRAREVLMRFVRTAFGPTDLVAIMDPLTPVDAIRFTRDRLELAEQVRTLRGRSGEYVPPRSVVEEAHLQAMLDVERLRSEVTLSALKSAAVHLGSLREGRKSIIAITEGMRGLGRDEPRIVSDLIEAANASNTAIYTINPRGLTMRRMRTFEMMEALASETGADYNTSNDPAQALLRVVKQASAFYLLGYASRGPMDGKFHKIKVRVKRDGMEVRARSGYWAPSLAEMERSRRLAAAATLPPDIARALNELPPANARRTIDLWAGATLANDRPAVRLAWSPRAAEPGKETRGVPATVSVVATSGTEGVFEGEIEPGGTMFRAPAGDLRVVTSVFDAAGELIDRETRIVAVPDLAASPLAITSPLVLRSQGPLELRELRSAPSPPAFAGREFQRTDRLLIRFTVHGPESTGAQVTATLMNRRAVRLTPLTVGRLEGTRGDWEIDLPLQSVARGEFLISIQASRGGARADALVPLRIVR